MLAAVAALGLIASPAVADFSTGFEPPYVASAAGTALAGQQGWYIPAVAASSGYSAYTYAGNTLGLPANPFGQAQFIGAATPGPTFPRAQLDVDFSTAGGWRVTYDVAHRYNGVLPAAQNLASFSLQNPNAAAFRQFIALHTWADLAGGTTWNAGFNIFNAAGVAQATQSPGAAWNNLLVDRWYRESIEFSFIENRILSVSITDLSLGTTNTATPANWYLQGGANPGALALPSAIRFFTGGSPDVGNVAGFDNLGIQPIPEPGSCVLCGLGAVGLFVLMRRRRSA
jgi:hypothetical protein